MKKPPLPVHRLDAPTEGLLITALTEDAQQSLQDAFRQHQIQKEYLCLVRGTPTPAHAVRQAFLHKDALHARVAIHSREQTGDKQIITEYTVLRTGEVSLLRVRLHTGRTHQIRAHLAFLGYPLLGDDLYGDRSFNKAQKARQLKLCSSALRFETDGSLAYLKGRSFTAEPDFLKKEPKGE